MSHYQKAPQCSACNRVEVQGAVKRRYCPTGDHSDLQGFRNGLAKKSATSPE